MNLSSVFLSLSSSELSNMLVESSTFRNSVSSFLLKNKNKKSFSKENKQIENLKNEIKKAFPDCNTDAKIPAIKFFRNYPFSPALKNQLKKLGIMDNEDYIELIKAKRFVESL